MTFGVNEQLLRTGSIYLHILGPVYGFFGLGFSLYFAAQGAGRLNWPLAAEALRLVVFAGVGALVLRLTGSLSYFFAIGAIAMVTYGTVVAWSVVSGHWTCIGSRRTT